MAKPEFEDDGRAVANMNVEGMPWFSPSEAPEAPAGGKTPLGIRETWRFIFGTLAAALSVGAVFLAGAALFILFCQYVWLR
jgi:hypothetical protein